MSDEEWKLFRQEMTDVLPIAKSERSDSREKKLATPGEKARRQAAVTVAKKDTNTLSTDFVTMLDPLDVLSFRREGLQHGVFRKLKQGRYEIDARLDLHRMTVQQARREVYAFVRDSCQYDLRTVLILHGKGRRNLENPALLKSYAAKWLQELEEVIAYHSAQKRDGGVGAVYVMLKKSERLKRENRERHGLRANREDK